MTTELIKAAQKGSHEAFLALLRQYDRQLMSVVYRFSGSYSDREDLYQDIFIHVFQSLGKFKFEASFKTWLYRVALNRCITYLRRKPVELELDPAIPVHHLDFEKRAKVRAIFEGLRKLRGPQRICFHLFYVEGWSVEEIAEVQGCRPGTVKAHLQRARTKIKSEKEVRLWIANPV